MSNEARVLRIGIASTEQMRARTIAIAQGKYKPSADEPKVWFTSVESLAQVLSRPNKLLLEIIRNAKPESMTELAKLSGREISNLSRTLKTMERYGIVRLNRIGTNRLAPEVLYDRVAFDMPLAA